MGHLNLFNFIACSLFCIVFALPSELISIANNDDHGHDDVAQKVEFYLYNDETNYSREAGRKLMWNNLTSLTSAGIKVDEPLTLFIHGFLHNYTCMFPQQLKDTYFDRGVKGNFVAVDWGKIAQPPGDYRKTYMDVLEKIPLVAQQVRHLIVALRQNNLIDLNTTHIIGFSLGAHIAGNAGSKVAKIYPEKIARLTALDPAGPFFHPYVNPLVSFVRPRRLQKEDARFVTVVHTDMADTLWSQLTGTEYGTNQKLGHTDFYMNGGRPQQPGCRNESDAESRSTCSHNAAPNYFMQSIGTNQWTGCPCTYREYHPWGSCQKVKKCDTPAIFGDHAQPWVEGDFYVTMETLVDMSVEYSC